jgi:hypothetical protein
MEYVWASLVEPFSYESLFDNQIHEKFNFKEKNDLKIANILIKVLNKEKMTRPEL